MNQVDILPLASLLIFMILNESIIEYLFGNVDFLKPYLSLVSLAVGIVLAVVYQIDLFKLVGMTENVPFGTLLSGFVISRGSNILNDFAQKFLGSK